MLGLMTMSLILTTRRSLTKAVLASESFWNLGTPRLHLMRTITLSHSQDNVAFLSTNILYVSFPSFILLFYCFITLYIFLEFSIFSLFHPLKTAVEAVESLCFYILSQRTFFHFFTCVILAVAARYFHLPFIF